MANEICAKCGLPMICGHLISIDRGRASYWLCCLCAGELINGMNRELIAGE